MRKISHKSAQGSLWNYLSSVFASLLSATGKVFPNIVSIVFFSSRNANLFVVLLVCITTEGHALSHKVEKEEKKIEKRAWNAVCLFVYIQLCKYPGTAEGCLSWVQSRSVPPLSCGLSLWSTDGRSAGEPHPLLSGPPRIHLNRTQTQKQTTGLGMNKESIWKK